MDSEMSLINERNVTKTNGRRPKIVISSCDQQLGEQYWGEKQTCFKNGSNSKGYRELQSGIVESMRKSIGIRNNKDTTLVDNGYLSQNGKLSDYDLKKLSGRRLLGSESGLQVGPYKINHIPGTAIARITDVNYLEGLIEKSGQEKTVKLEKFDVLELNNLLDRATESLDVAVKKDINFEKLDELVTEWQNKFPEQDVYNAIIGDVEATGIYKEMQGDKAIIVAPEATADLFKMKLYVERARLKLIDDSNVELDSQKLPIVIRKVWKFICDTEKSLYPEGYYIFYGV